MNDDVAIVYRKQRSGGFYEYVWPPSQPGLLLGLSATKGSGQLKRGDLTGIERKT